MRTMIVHPYLFARVCSMKLNLWQPVWLLGLLTLLIVSCRATYDPEAEFQKRLADSKAAVERKDWRTAYDKVESDMMSGSEAHKLEARKILSNIPELQANLIDSTGITKSPLASSSDALTAAVRIRRMRVTGILTDEQLHSLDMELDKAIVAYIDSGKRPYFTLSSVSELPILGREPYLREIVIGTLQNLKQEYDYSNLSALLSFYDKQPETSLYRKEVTDALPQLKIRRDDLVTGPIPRLFPSFASAQLAARTVPISIKTDPSRRLLEEDVMTVLRSRSPALLVSRDENSKLASLTVVIRELQLDERNTPPGTQTVVVDHSAVDIMTAVLLLPRNASVLFDVTKGESSLEYAYELILMVNGKPAGEKLLRDRTKENWHQCSNLRYQNVFGGVGALGVWPNQQVQSFCQSGQEPVSPAKLKSRAHQTIVNSILAFDPVAAALKRAGD